MTNVTEVVAVAGGNRPPSNHDPFSAGMCGLLPLYDTFMVPRSSDDCCTIACLWVMWVAPCHASQVNTEGATADTGGQIKHDNRTYKAQGAFVFLRHDLPSSCLSTRKDASRLWGLKRSRPMPSH